MSNIRIISRIKTNIGMDEQFCLEINGKNYDFNLPANILDTAEWMLSKKMGFKVVNYLKKFKAKEKLNGKV